MQSFDNLVKIIQIADLLYFYDNSKVIENEQQQKFANLEKIAEKQEYNIYIKKNIEWFDMVINQAKEMNFLSNITIRSK